MGTNDKLALRVVENHKEDILRVVENYLSDRCSSINLMYVLDKMLQYERVIMISEKQSIADWDGAHL
jgi:hypothetical protein